MILIDIHFSILVESEDVLLGGAEELEADNSVDLEEELIGLSAYISFFVLDNDYWVSTRHSWLTVNCLQ